MAKNRKPQEKFMPQHFAQHKRKDDCLESRKRWSREQCVCACFAHPSHCDHSGGDHAYLPWQPARIQMPLGKPEPPLGLPPVPVGGRENENETERRSKKIK